jgi:hypothetical protein
LKFKWVRYVAKKISFAVKYGVKENLGDNHNIGESI